MTAGRSSVEPRGGPPTVGVVVVAYRRKHLLERALTSIAKGTELPDRVVVVEDNPPYSESSSELLDRLFPTVPHASVNHEFDPIGGLHVTGIEQCPTDVVAFLEDDDLFLPRKVATLRSIFAEHPEIGYVRHCFRAVDSELASIPMSRRTLRVPRGIVAPDPKAWAAARIFGHCSSIAFRREPCLANLAVIGQLSAAPDRGLFWLALRSGLVPYAEPTVLTLKAIHLQSTSWLPFIYARQRRSLEYLRSRSPPGSAEELFATMMMRRLPAAVEDRVSAPRSREVGFGLLATLQRRLPPRPASWVRRGSLMLVLALTR